MVVIAAPGLGTVENDKPVFVSTSREEGTKFPGLFPP